MDTKQTGQQSLHITQEQLVAYVRAMIGGSRGREDDQHPLPPGPWDPVIRVALEQIRIFSPRPERWKSYGPARPPWGTAESGIDPRSELVKVVFEGFLGQHPELTDVTGGGHGVGEEVALNPQPLPPRYAFLVAVAQAVIRRVELLQEITDATARDGSQQGIIIVGGYISRFSDEWCGTGFRLRWPFAGPRPHWLANELDGIDLMVMAMEFEQGAKETFSPALREHLRTTSARFAEVGMSKIQYLIDGTGYAGSGPTSGSAT